MVNTKLTLNKHDERRILLNRLFYDDRDLYKLGKKAGISWFDSFEKKFTQDTYAHCADYVLASNFFNAELASGQPVLTNSNKVSIIFNLLFSEITELLYIVSNRLMTSRER